MLPARLEKRDIKRTGIKRLIGHVLSVIRVVVLMLAVVQASAREGDATETAEIKILFRFYLPDAPEVKRVEVIGNFNSWRHGSTPLQGPDKNGKWEATVILKPGLTRVEYIYLVDGRRFLDSGQARISDDFGSDNHILILPETAMQGLGEADAASTSR